MRNERGHGELSILALLAAITWILALTGCMQLTGAKHIDLWGAKFDANNGIEVSAGVQQYDRVDNRKGIGERN
jgi:hypothetical protein